MNAAVRSTFAHNPAPLTLRCGAVSIQINEPLALAIDRHTSGALQTLSDCKPEQQQHTHTHTGSRTQTHLPCALRGHRMSCYLARYIIYHLHRWHHRHRSALRSAAKEKKGRKLWENFLSTICLVGTERAPGCFSGGLNAPKGKKGTRAGKWTAIVEVPRSP